MNADNEEKRAQLVDRMETMRRRGAEWNRALVADVEMTLAFISGFQWMEYRWKHGGLTPIETKSRSVRITDNRMLPAYTRTMYSLFLEKPVLVGHEGSKELGDTEAAAAAGKLFDYWEKHCGLRAARREAVGWMMISGIGFCAPAWTTSRGMQMVEQPEVLEEPKKNEQGQWSFLGSRKARVKTKEITFWSLNPLNTYCFPLSATKWTEVDSVMNVDLASREWILRNIPNAADFADKMKEVGDAQESQEAQDRVNKYVSSFFGMRTDSEPGDRYWVMRFWERPTNERPEGRYVVTAGGQVAVDTKLPYAEDALKIDPTDSQNLTMGIVPIRAIDLPGRLVPPAPFAEMRRAQIRLNDLLTDQARNRKTVGRNKLLVQRDSLREGQWDDEHGEMIEIDPQEAGFKPQYVQAPPLVGIDAELNRAEMSLEESSGQTAVLRGQNPTQARAAEQLEILREESMTLLSSYALQHEAGFENIGRLSLAITQKRYSLERMANIIGRRRSGWGVQLKHADLLTDVRIKTGSLIPRNHALTEAKVVDRVRYGIYNDPETGKPDVRLIRKMLEMGSFAPADMEQMHRDRAEQEFLWIVLEQKIVEALDEEPHEVHIQQHRADMARQEFAEADYDVQELYRLHMQSHREKWADQMNPESSMPMPGTLTNGVFDTMNAGRPRPRPAGGPSSGGQGGGQAGGRPQGQQSGGQQSAPAQTSTQ